MKLIPWTSPTIPCEIYGIDLTTYDEVKVSLVQGRVKYHKTPDSISYDSEESKSTVLASFTQEETGKLRKGTAEVQVNFMLNDGRDAVLVKEIEVDEQLYEQVME